MDGASKYFAIEQIVPPPSVRDQVESKREAAKEKKYARNPHKKAFMVALIAALRAAGVAAVRSRGESYRCWFENGVWPKETWVSLSIHGATPQLYYPKALKLELDPLPAGSTLGQDGDYSVVSFGGVSSTTVPPPGSFVEAVKSVVGALVAQPVS